MHRTHLWSKQIEEKKKQNQLHFQRQWNEETLERRKNWGVAVSRSAPSPCVTVTSDSRRPMLQDCKYMAVWWWHFFFFFKEKSGEIMHWLRQQRPSVQCGRTSDTAQADATTGEGNCWHRESSIMTIMRGT